VASSPNKVTLIRKRSRHRGKWHQSKTTWIKDTNSDNKWDYHRVLIAFCE